jgi:hypothetical protein
MGDTFWTDCAYPALLAFIEINPDSNAAVNAFSMLKDLYQLLSF